MFSFIRAMDQSDLNTVLTIEQASYTFPWSQKAFESSLDQGLNYVFCSDEGGILGYCCLLPVLDEVQILNLCVSPDCQRLAVAHKGLSKVMSSLQASGYARLLLEVRVSNTAARALYNRFGFCEDGLRKGYYRDRYWDEPRQQFISTKEDAVLMSLPL